jgi:hypothetical protein
MIGLTREPGSHSLTQYAEAPQDPCQRLQLSNLVGFSTNAVPGKDRAFSYLLDHFP